MIALQFLTLHHSLIQPYKILMTESGRTVTCFYSLETNYVYYVFYRFSMIFPFILPIIK